jgi:predicted RNA binding protein YcfA (HicA-like mRNA interferase family)
MPRLRRLSGKEVLKIFEALGFELVSVSGSHHKLRRVVNGQHQTLTISIHANQTLHPKMIRKLFRDALRYIDEETLNNYFYSE